jgi:serine/threonine-protein kinase
VPTATRILGETPPEAEGGDRVSASYESQPEHLQRALGDHYELGRLIARGGYAEVFAVRDLRLKRELAVKVLRPDLVVTQALLARFRREAEAVAALQHPQIVPVYDVGEADGICYILMPLIRGESLKSLLQREGRLPTEEVRRILVESASALGAAHRAGIIHRDIKPENIMVEGSERRVLLMDFGIAKAVDAVDRERTGTGVIVGTPQYMSPEQASGDPNIDHRTDQYSLAVVGYQMASGRVPFEGETARAIMTRQLLEAPPPIRDLVGDLPAPLAYALHRALQKDRTRRFDSMEEFVQALEAASAPRLAAWGASRPKRRWIPWTVGVAAMVLVGLSVAQWRPTPPAAFAPPPEDSSPAPTPPPARSSVPVSLPQDARSGSPGPASPPLTRVDTLVIEKQVPAPDTGTRGAAAKTPDCATAYDGGDWPTAYTQCVRESSSSPQASRLAGLLVFEGRVGDADTSRGLSLLEQAMRQGDAEARVLLRERQFHVAQRREATDPSGSTRLYLAAATNGYEPAYVVVARRLTAGLGTPRNFPDAARYYEKAAEAHDSEGMYQIAMIYLNGRGVPKSEPRGMMWLERAAAADHSGAKKELAARKK